MQIIISLLSESVLVWIGNIFRLVLFTPGSANIPRKLSFKWWSDVEFENYSCWPISTWYLARLNSTLAKTCLTTSHHTGRRSSEDWGECPHSLHLALIFIATFIWDTAGVCVGFVGGGFLKKVYLWLACMYHFNTKTLKAVHSIKKLIRNLIKMLVINDRLKHRRAIKNQQEGVYKRGGGV